MTWTKVGMKVVCVDASNWKFAHEQNRSIARLPTQGGVYTIKDAWAGKNGTLCISLMEMDNSHIPSPFGPEPGFQIRRFRPLVTKTQSDDVAMFKRIADQVPNMEDVE